MQVDNDYNDWQYLSHAAATILERIDINHCNLNIPIGETLEIPYFKGVITEELAEEIIRYQHSMDHKGDPPFSAEIKDGNLVILFLKSGL